MCAAQRMRTRLPRVPRGAQASRRLHTTRHVRKHEQPPDPCRIAEAVRSLVEAAGVEPRRSRGHRGPPQATAGEPRTRDVRSTAHADAGETPAASTRPATSVYTNSSPTRMDRRSCSVTSGGGGSRTRVRKTVKPGLYVRRVLLISPRVVSTQPVHTASHLKSHSRCGDITSSQSDLSTSERTASDRQSKRRVQRQATKSLRGHRHVVVGN